MSSGPITSWQIDREKVETVTDFILLGSKITADGECSHKIKRHLLLGRKAMTKLDSEYQTFGLRGRGRGWDDLGEWEFQHVYCHVRIESPVHV